MNTLNPNDVGSSIASRATEAQKILLKLSGISGCFKERLVDLEDRLSPVLMPTPKLAGELKEKVPEYGTKFFGELDSYLESLEQSLTYLQNIKDRLEV